jgi:hypothetical protein
LAIEGPLRDRIRQQADEQAERRLQREHLELIG